MGCPRQNRCSEHPFFPLPFSTFFLLYQPQSDGTFWFESRWGSQVIFLDTTNIVEKLRARLSPQIRARFDALASHGSVGLAWQAEIVNAVVSRGLLDDNKG